MTSEAYDAERARSMAVGLLREAGAYVSEHAEDFLPRAGSDEVTMSDGLDVTIHVRFVDELPTITVRREAILLPEEGWK